MESADIAEMKRRVGLTTGSASRETSNASALALMLDDGVRSIIVVDEMSRPVGVVRRDDIVARMLVKLASGDAS